MISHCGSPEALSYDILSGMREWHLQHPDATLTEIEQALDERWYRVRARMLQNGALEQEATTWQAQATRNVSSSLRQLRSEFKHDRLACIGHA